MASRLPFILHSTESANARFERCVRFFVSALVQGSALCKNFRIFLVISSNPRSALFMSCLLWAFFPLGILSLWAFCLFRHNVFWAFYPVWHFVVLGQNVFWAFYPWAFCHTWAFCHFGHFIIESEKGEGKQNKNKANSFTLALYFADLSNLPPLLAITIAICICFYPNYH